MTGRYARPRLRLKPRKPRREYRHKFSGVRYDTEPVNEIVTNEGMTFIKREDGSKYPKLTSISVSQSVREIYSEMNLERYNNYDELLTDLAEKWFLQRKPHLNRAAVANYERLLAKAHIDCHFRKIARKKAISKHRYFW